MKAVFRWCPVCEKRTRSESKMTNKEYHHWCIECGEICLLCGKKWPEQLPKRKVHLALEGE